jgi:hypothetical protein
MATIHVTERQTFKACRRQWKYQYQEHLVPRREESGALWIGRGVHYALANYYVGKDPDTALQEWLDIKLAERYESTGGTPIDPKLEESITLMRDMVSRYPDFARQNDDWEVVAVEKPFSVKIPTTQGRLEGTLDLVVRRNGRLWVVDHKTFASFVSPDQLELDDQMTAYLWLVQQIFKEVPAGAIYNQLRKSIPKKPALLKDGLRFSKDKSIDTTEEIYLAAVQEQGFDPNDYQDILEKLRLNEFFKREIIARNPNELDSFEANLIDEYRQMTTKRRPLYPSPSRDCQWCDYRTLCKAENEKGDVKSLRDYLYETRLERRL